MLPMGVFLLLFACQQVVFYGAKAFSSYAKPLLYGLKSFCLFLWGKKLISYALQAGTLFNTTWQCFDNQSILSHHFANSPLNDLLKHLLYMCIIHPAEAKVCIFCGVHNIQNAAETWDCNHYQRHVWKRHEQNHQTKAWKTPKDAFFISKLEVLFVTKIQKEVT